MSQERPKKKKRKQLREERSKKKVEKGELINIIKEKDDLFSFLMKGFGDILPTDDDITSPLSIAIGKRPF